MSPEAGELLLNEVAPRIRNSIANSALQVGADDVDELVQDAVAIAANLLVSAEARGKQISAGNAAFYSVRLVRQGRRSTGQSRTDVMAPMAQISGRSCLVSLDSPLTSEADGEETMSTHDLLAGHSEDPASAAVRHLDWERLLPALDARKLAVSSAWCMARI